MSIDTTDNVHETEVQQYLQETVGGPHAIETHVPLSNIRLIMSDQDIAFQRWLIQHEAQLNSGIKRSHNIRSY